VLIILAGVSISLVLGDNGIVTKAKEAKQNMQVAANEEQASLANLEVAIGEESNGTTTPPVVEEQAKVGEIVTEKNKPYTKNGTAVIPVGFAIVPGLDDVSKGLVISDVANDTADEGNQFVWIPVNRETFATKFKRTAGYSNNSLQSMTDYGEADATGVNAKFGEYSKEENATVRDEAIAMYESVRINGGFYIGRYETGNEGGTYNYETKKWEGTSKLVVKKGAPVYNYIGWSNSNTMTNVVGGAVEAARGMYTGKKTLSNENYGVVSTLCYGVQWDAALNFIDPDYITNEIEGKPNCQADSYLVKSDGKGWYRDNYSSGNHPTGVDVDSRASNKVKNIYDMAGNVWEWTMESGSSDGRVFRGRWLLHCWLLGSSFWSPLQ